jgi:hypothetical protein
LPDGLDRVVDLGGQVRTGQLVDVVLGGTPVELRPRHPVLLRDVVEALRRVVREADRCLHEATV